MISRKRELWRSVGNQQSGQWELTSQENDIQCRSLDDTGVPIFLGMRQNQVSAVFSSEKGAIY